MIDYQDLRYAYKARLQAKDDWTRNAIDKKIRTMEKSASVDTITTAKRDLIIERFAVSDDGLAKQALTWDAERLNARICSHDIDVQTIAFVMNCCGSYANDRQHGLALCDNGCGDRIGYTLMII